MGFYNSLVFLCYLIALAIYFLFGYLAKRNDPIFNYNKKMREITKRKRRNVRVNDKGTLIGYEYRTPVYTPDDAKHIFICGTTGSGKTVALSNFIKRANNMGCPLLIIDGKGDINEGSLLELAKLFSNRKLYIINLSNPAASHKYNPFKNANPTVCKDMLINLTNWSEEHYKLNTERYLLRVAMLMQKSNIEYSFHSILKYIGIKAFGELSKDLASSGIITKEEHLGNLELANTSGKIAETAIARFSLLAESELGGIFAPDGVDILTALQEKSDIIFVLNPLLYPETSSLMGRLILIDSKKAVSELFSSKNRCFFMFDEINSYSSSVLVDLVNKSRSANVTCILATQSLSDLDFAVDLDFKEQIIECCNNYILLRQNSAKNAEAWANIIGTETKAETTYQLSNKTGRTLPTGAGTLKFNKQYIYHPDEIKNLKTGEAFYISKDNGEKTHLLINKPF